MSSYRRCWKLDEIGGDVHPISPWSVSHSLLLRTLSSEWALTMIRPGFLETLEAGEKGKILSSGEMEFLLSANPEEREVLFQAADRTIYSLGRTIGQGPGYRRSLPRERCS